MNAAHTFLVSWLIYQLLGLLVNLIVLGNPTLLTRMKPTTPGQSVVNLVIRMIWMTWGAFVLLNLNNGV